jgi:hypothetical protein
MKKAPKKPNDGMRKEYDFSQALVGKYARAYAEGTNVILLDKDVSEVFPDAKSANEALRSLIRIAGRSARKVVKAS